MAKTGLEYFDSNEEKYQCLICGRCFLIVCDEKVLIEHLHNNHRKKLNDLNVQKVEETYCIENHLLNQFSKQDSNLYKCNFCANSYSTLKIHKNDSLVFARHIYKNHLEHSSPEILKMVNLYNRMQKNAKKKKDKNYFFAIDHFVFQTSSIIKCNYCLFSKKWKRVLMKHLTMHLIAYHKEIVPADIQSNVQSIFQSKIYKCQICGKIKNSPAALEIHEAFHLKKKRFFCKHCNKGFVLKQCVQRHILNVHSDEKPNTCDVCGAGFKTKTILKTHLRVHTGETPFQCKKCEKRFKFQASRDSHKCIP